MANWCIDELRYKASHQSADAPIFVYNGDVVKSDTAVSLDLKETLQKAVMKFELAIPENAKDWHPGSDGKVLDLVHPSLYPLVYGRTRILYDGQMTSLDDCIERCGQGKTVDIPFQEGMFSVTKGSYGFLDEAFSYKFQWLPCEVDISGESSKYFFSEES